MMKDNVGPTEYLTHKDLWEYLFASRIAAGGFGDSHSSIFGTRDAHATAVGVLFKYGVFPSVHDCAGLIGQLSCQIGKGSFGKFSVVVIFMFLFEKLMNELGNFFERYLSSIACDC